MKHTLLLLIFSLPVIASKIEKKIYVGIVTSWNAKELILTSAGKKTKVPMDEIKNYKPLEGEHIRIEDGRVDVIGLIKKNQSKKSADSSIKMK